MVITQKASQDPYTQEKVLSFLQKQDIACRDISLFILAFTHRSIVNERNDFAPQHNERLEFLGDAVLELVITSELFKDFPQKHEGDLTDMRSALVRGRNLAEIAKKIDLGSCLLLGKGEEKGGGRENEYILANTFEAFVGAIFTDLGFESAKKFILDMVYTTLPHILENNLFKDFKTLLQEYTQAKLDITPHYEVLSESGPDHNKSFVVGVYIGEKLIGEGEGSSKKKSQEKAAEKAYLAIK